MACPIVFATDLTGSSESAFRRAIDLAQEKKAELVIAYVYAPPSKSPADDWLMPGLSSEIDAAACEEATEKVQPFVARARQAGLRARGLVVPGEPARMVAWTARRLGADLVVVGTHARRGLRRLLKGSVAANIAARATCPVLTVATV